MSSTTDIIRYPAQDPFVVIRQCYLAITGGDKNAAAVLNWAEQWHKYKLRARQQAQVLNNMKRGKGEAADQNEELWIFRTIAEIASEDLLGFISERTLAKVMDKLVRLRFISRRHNPAAPYDRTLQYCFEPENVQAAIDALEAGYVSSQGRQKQGKTPSQSHSEKLPNAKRNCDNKHLEKLPDVHSEKLPDPFGNFSECNNRFNIDTVIDSEREGAANPKASPPPPTAFSLSKNEEETEIDTLPAGSNTPPSFGGEVELSKRQTVTHQAPDNREVPPASDKNRKTRTTKAYLSSVFGSNFLRSLLRELAPYGLDRSQSWLSLPLSRVQELATEAQRTHEAYKVKPLTRLRDLLDQACRALAEVEQAPKRPTPFVGMLVNYCGDIGKLVHIGRVFAVGEFEYGLVNIDIEQIRPMPMSVAPFAYPGTL